MWFNFIILITCLHCTEIRSKEAKPKWSKLACDCLIYLPYITRLDLHLTPIRMAVGHIDPKNLGKPQEKSTPMEKNILIIFSLTARPLSPPPP